MKLNAFEFYLMNNPIRAAIQRHYEAPSLERLAFAPVEGAHVLEIGCGRGVGSQIILERFGAARVDAFDLDERMVERARARLGRYGDRVNLWVGSATAIPAEDATYDAVFDFGIIHHIPRWREALDEVARVLKPGGQFFFEEVLRDALDRPSFQRFTDHPKDDRFDSATFIKEIEARGIAVADHRKTLLGDEYLIAVGRKAA
ncbi:MAG: class I SAM-dependent methyltransferase [Myxococcales bacterium]|nr:class I SAM-dependent methyltransferase [Myxococcales bacterium]